MKKITALFMTLAFVLNLFACAATQPGNLGEEPTQGPTWQEQYDLGVHYLSEGNYQEAIIAFTAAIEIDPKQVLAYVGRGDAYVLSGETETNLAAAKADYEKAIELDETIAEAYLGLADVYIRQDAYEQASEILRQGYEITHVSELLERIKHIQNQINAEKDAWIFTNNMLEPKELTVGGVPFWEANIERVLELFPSDDEMKDSSWIILDNGIQYTQYLNRVSVVIAYQESDNQGLNSIYFSAYDNYSAAANYSELRGIRLGTSRQLVLKELGLTTDGIEFCLSFESGKVLRFICIEDIWTEDIEPAGSISSGSAIEFIWPNFDSGQELMLKMEFNEIDSLNRIIYTFLNDLGY